MKRKNIIGYWSLSNFGGVAVLDIDEYSNQLLIQWYDEEPEWVKVEEEVGDIIDEDTEEFIESFGRGYIQIGELRLCLDECLRV